MIMTVYNLLKPLNLPVKFLQRPDFGGNSIAISYHFFNETDMQYGDGEPNKNGGSLQVDVFSQGGDYTQTVNDIKTILTTKGFLFSYSNDDIENLGNSEQIYHKIIRFNYIESEVEK